MVVQIRIICSWISHMASSLVQEIAVVVSSKLSKVGFCAGLAAEWFTVTDLLKVVKSASDATISGRIESIESSF